MIRGCKNSIIPSSVTTIEGNAFCRCSSLTSITIPEGVTTIGFNAFSGCTSLKSITIPESVTQIGEDAFKNTPWYNNFEDGEIYIGKVLYKYKGEMPQNTTINIKEGVTQIGVNAFSGCNGLTSITIPESVTTIGGYAFSNCSSLTSITIPEGVTIIGHFAFSNCSSLTSIIIPNSVTTIEGRAFEGCSSLTSITIPESVTSIGSYAFYGCSNLEKIVCLAKEIPTLKNYALYNVSPYTILVPINSVDVYKNAVRWSIYNDKIIGGYVVKGLSNNDTKGVVNITQPIVEKDKQTTITAIAAENHIFTQWSDGVKENPRTITVVSDTTFTAEFEKNAEQNNQEGSENKW